MINKLAELANELDSAELFAEADIIDALLVKEAAKVKARNRQSPVFDSTHPKVKDNKDHFPLGNISQARNALARANQFTKKPDWWKGTLQELVNAVARAVKKKYPAIEISKSSRKPGKG